MAPVAELLAYAATLRADVARAQLSAACAATGSSIRLEILGSGALYQRLNGARPVPPPPDLVWWFGPFAAHAAAGDGFLSDVQSIDASSVAVVGPPVKNLSDLASVPRLALADPERSEVGMAILLATLDHARQAQGDVEQGWAWWQQRAAAGMPLAEDDPGALALVQSGAATHALTLSSDGAPLSDVAPIPHALALGSNSRNMDDARRLLEWLSSKMARSTGQAASSLDIDWCTRNYAATRQRWANSAFSPSLAA